MKKTINILLCMLALLSSTRAQYIVSIANGNWSDPQTWDCNCIPPLSGFSITVAHNVTLDSSLSFSGGGGIYINAAASLVQDASMNRDIIMVSTGFLNNGGLLDIHDLKLSYSYNTGTIHVNNFWNDYEFTNTNAAELTAHNMYVNFNFSNGAATPLVADSLWVLYGHFANYGGSSLNVGYVYNQGTFYSGGTMQCQSLVNRNSYQNITSLTVSGNLVNEASVMNSGAIDIGGDFINDSGNSSSPATFNSGPAVITVHDSWYNTGNVIGIGGTQFIVNDSSVNSGTMSQYFDFCDLTPPASFPAIDINTGSVDPGISFCGVPSGLKYAQQTGSLSLFPNPSSGDLTIKGTKEASYNIINSLGEGQSLVELTEENNFNVHITDLPIGIYFLVSKENQIHTKIVITE